MTLSVIVVDDERVARARLRRLLSTDPDVRLLTECADGREAVAAILEHQPDLVFLDIEMPELNGFQVLKTLPPESVPSFIFVTAFKDYALDAFSVDALDYLLKPIDAERVQEALARARRRTADTNEREPLLRAIEQLTAAQEEIKAAVTRPAPGGRFVDATQPLERLTVRVDGRVMFVRTDAIDFIESAANYVKIHVGTQCYPVREQIGVLASRLNASKFRRIHRTTVVNIDRIKEVQPWFSGDAIVILRDGRKLRLSRMYRKGLDL